VSTPYKLLGISVDADEETIRAAFRTAAKRYHPDLNPDDPLAERRFRRLIRARDMLLDPERRSIHAGKNVLWHSRWRSPAKSTSGKIIGGVLVAISLFLIQRFHGHLTIHREGRTAELPLTGSHHRHGYRDPGRIPPCTIRTA
jgi:curved DNA-binding protein CbpA